MHMDLTNARKPKAPVNAVSQGGGRSFRANRLQPSRAELLHAQGSIKFTASDAVPVSRASGCTKIRNGLINGTKKTVSKQIDARPILSLGCRRFCGLQSAVRLRARWLSPPNGSFPGELACSVQFSSRLFLCAREGPLCAPPPVSQEFPPMLPQKQFHCWSDCPMALPRPLKEDR